MNFSRYNPTNNTYDNRFQVYVAWVDHNSTIKDEQQEGAINSITNAGRNYHIGGFRLSANTSGMIVNVIVPQEVLGSFKLPQIGDIVWVEESRRSNDTTPVYVFSSYSKDNGLPAPIWGSMYNDYGHLRTHRDHSEQFLTTTKNADFRTQYIRSITGYRFRRFYESNLEAGKFVMRGDPVFDVEPAEINRPYLINSGSPLIYGGTVEEDKGKYPEPLNVPKEREKDEAYTYVNVVYAPLGTSISPDHYDRTPKSGETPTQAIKTVLKTKNYLAYQPVMDKKYLDAAKFQREIPAAEEYQVALRGNNKLLIQDQAGDGEQLLITLKTQYDEQFTIVHNGERGQVRIRDHLGQGVLLDADPEAPRVLSWTANKQVIEQGSVKGKGEFTYIRNGPAFGDSQTSFGTKTGSQKANVPNQEFLMVSTPDIIGELSSRLSPGLFSLANGAASPGIYFRNNSDPDAKSQDVSLYSEGTTLVTKLAQQISGLNGVLESSSITQILDGSSSSQLVDLQHLAPGAPHTYSESISVSAAEYTKTSVGQKVGSDTITTLEFVGDDNSAMSMHDVLLTNTNQVTVTYDGTIPSAKTEVKLAGATASIIEQTGAAVDVKRDAIPLPINIGVDGMLGGINIGNPADTINIVGTAVNITADTVAIEKA